MTVGEFLLQAPTLVCRHCGHGGLIPSQRNPNNGGIRPICPACQSTRYTWELSKGRGVVYTWTIVHGPTLPVFQDQVPYNVVDVLLDEGVHFQSQVLDCPATELRAGLPVQAVFVPVSEDITLVKFRRA